ncbi:penicillin acylase family protein [Arthrobacter globiformis]|uniref:penicillin acylase family protein n=1 Tax=Arthrobacter globiformis TaxID=1665 RepID=UPI00277D8387|nr:penicillin acylase family protein [Arthrobacter globiformis]MDQ0864547.1 penicillin amidase [Arthrobacter globiformis]
MTHESLRGPVVIDQDEFGVSHIRATNSDDVFFAQGYVAARDRLFQLDLWRRRGLGLLSEVLGDAYVDRDRAARLFLYRGDMRAEWLAYSAGAQQAVTRFVDGINHRVREVLANPDRLSADFVRLGYAPALWQPEDVVRIRAHGNGANAEQELARALTIRDFGPAVDDLRKARQPASPVKVPDGLDLTTLSEDALSAYRTAQAPIDQLGPLVSAPAGGVEGSNSWAIAPHLTSSGHAILASDPHRAMNLPSLRYVVHLTCPEFDVIGAGEPMIPGVSIGHNGHVAFGLTYHPIDQEDIYVYDLDETGTRYRYQDGWREFTCEDELIPLPGGETSSVQLLFTVHGPVTFVDVARSKAYALRAAWLEPGSAPYLASLEYLTARDVGAHATALGRWNTPGCNHIYTDTAGQIGWQVAGLVPIRPNWDGLLPVPGDGRYEWAGFRTPLELPNERNPERGWVASANEANVPDSHLDLDISREYYAPFRYERIAEALSTSRNWTVARASDLQTDRLSLPARDIISLLREDLAVRETDDDEAAAACALLAGWDCRMLSDSRQAALFEVWFRRYLRPSLYRRALKRDDVAAELADSVLNRILPAEDILGARPLDLLLLRDERLWKGREDRARLLRTTLGVAWHTLQAAHGEIPRWGELHRIAFSHPAAAQAAGEDTAGWETISALPADGSADTVGLAAYDANGNVTIGASFRMIVDVGDWDRSIFINAPGQSGDPASPHYKDLLKGWQEGEYVPLLYTRDAIERATLHQVRWD